MNKIMRTEKDFGSKPIKWNDQRCKQAYELALLGVTEDQMARVMDVSVDTIAYWKKTKPEFLRALMDGRTLADVEVAKAFYRTCTGYEYEEDVVLQYRGNTEIVRVRKVVPANPYACAKWLAIRQRETWTDVNKMEINQNITVKPIDLSDISSEDLVKLESIGLKQLNARNN